LSFKNLTINERRLGYRQGVSRALSRIGCPAIPEGTKVVKGKILDELCKVYGYNRKYAVMNDLYANEPRLHMNLFQSSAKVLKAIRKGLGLRRIYNKPKTSLDPLIGLARTSEVLDKNKLEALQVFRDQLDPHSFIISPFS